MMVLPKWLYDAKPYLLGAGGFVVAASLESSIAWVATVAMIIAGVLIFLMRKNKTS